MHIVPVLNWINCLSLLRFHSECFRRTVCQSARMYRSSVMSWMYRPAMIHRWARTYTVCLHGQPSILGTCFIWYMFLAELNVGIYCSCKSPPLNSWPNFSCIYNVNATLCPHLHKSSSQTWLSFKYISLGTYEDEYGNIVWIWSGKLL